MSGVSAYYTDQVKIPGFGSARQRCRPYKAVGFCENGHPVLGRSSCGTRGCPDHFRDWVQQATVNVVARLAAYRQARGERIVHAVTSPPQEGRWSVRGLWESRSDAYEAAEAAGVEGGAAVLHPYRTSEAGDVLFETAVEDGDVPEGRGEWRVLRDAADDWEEMQHYVKPAPHVHQIAAAPDVEGSDAPEGWVVDRLRSLGPTGFHIRDMEAYREMAKPVYYVLTHAAVQQGRQSITWFGDLHPASFRPEEELTAAEWDRIKIEAERAVKTRPSDGPDPEVPSGPVGSECRREDCEAEVYDVSWLREFLEDEEWVGSVLQQQGGRKRWLRLRGMQLWLFEGGDRPPPNVQASEDKLLEWLEDQGRHHTAGPQQRRIDTGGVVALPD